jgi:uncharacterized protein YndB with AHSA1/START domain
MTSDRITRREVAVRVATIVSGVGAAATALGAPRAGWLAIPRAEEITRDHEAIHQEVAFKAPRKRVYEALVDAKIFEKVVQQSAATKSGMKLGTEPLAISREPGGVFTLYGGHISGRHVELVPEQRLVQAWRVAVWDPGFFSIARFVLQEDGSGTKLVFDHIGFPDGQGAHLAEGWKGNYWEPMAKVLA